VQFNCSAEVKVLSFANTNAISALLKPVSDRSRGETRYQVVRTSGRFYARLEVVTAALLKIQVILDVTPYRLVITDVSEYRIKLIYSVKLSRRYKTNNVTQSNVLREYRQRFQLGRRSWSLIFEGVMILSRAFSTLHVKLSYCYFFCCFV
jgi:hypothetical protein